MSEKDTPKVTEWIERCAAYIGEVTSPSGEKSLGEPVSSCGLCQVGIPCEASIPRRK